MKLSAHSWRQSEKMYWNPQASGQFWREMKWIRGTDHYVRWFKSSWMLYCANGTQSHSMISNKTWILSDIADITSDTKSIQWHHGLFQLPIQALKPMMQNTKSNQLFETNNKSMHVSCIYNPPLTLHWWNESQSTTYTGKEMFTMGSPACGMTGTTVSVVW